MKQTKLSRVAAIATDQWGMISTAQAATDGVSVQTLARLAANGGLERIAHGIYRMAGTPPRQHDDLCAAWIALDPRRTAAERIAAGPTEVVSHRSAAAVHEIGDLVDDRLEFTTSVRRQTRRDQVRLYRGTLAADDWTLVEGLPVTTLLRTIDDLATDRIDRGHLAGLVRDTLVRHSVPRDEVATVLAPHAWAYGVTAGDGGRLLDVLADEAGLVRAVKDVRLDAVRRHAQAIQQLLASLAQEVDTKEQIELVAEAPEPEFNQAAEPDYDQ